jgi:hypothetical protein
MAAQAQEIDGCRNYGKIGSMTDPASLTFGWRFFLPKPGTHNPNINFAWIVGTANKSNAYRNLVLGAFSMPDSLQPEPITFAEASKIGLKRDEVRRETKP